MRNSFKIVVILSFALSLSLALLNATEEINEFKKKIELSKKLTNEAIDIIMKRWDIANYPNFLRSAHMSHTAWEILKVNIFNFLLFYLLVFISIFATLTLDILV